MISARFEWDPRKAALNERKHGVSFEEAASAFDDPRALLADDPVHSAGERRFLLFGMSQRLRVLVVVHCERVPDEVYRIISARRTTQREQAYYWEGAR